MCLHKQHKTFHVNFMLKYIAGKTFNDSAMLPLYEKITISQALDTQLGRECKVMEGNKVRK